MYMHIQFSTCAKNVWVCIYTWSGRVKNVHSRDNSRASMVYNRSLALVRNFDCSCSSVCLPLYNRLLLLFCHTFDFFFSIFSLGTADTSPHSKIVNYLVTYATVVLPSSRMENWAHQIYAILWWNLVGARPGGNADGSYTPWSWLDELARCLLDDCLIAWAWSHKG